MTIEFIEKIEAIASHELPEGEFEGIYGGSELNFTANGCGYRVRFKERYRNMKHKVRVVIRDGKIEIN